MYLFIKRKISTCNTSTYLLELDYVGMIKRFLDYDFSSQIFINLQPKIKKIKQPIRRYINTYTYSEIGKKQHPGISPKIFGFGY